MNISIQGIRRFQVSPTTGNILINGAIDNGVDNVQVVGSLTATDLLISGQSIREISPVTYSAAHELVLSDRFRLVRMNLAADGNLTVPNNTTVAFPIGTQILVSQAGVGRVTIVPASGVTLNSADNAFSTRFRHSIITLMKIDTNTWIVSGDTI